MANLFKRKITITYKDNEGREYKVVRRIWEKKDENGDYYVTAIGITYPNRGFAIPMEYIHSEVTPSEWKCVQKESDYIRQKATSLPRCL